MGEAQNLAQKPFSVQVQSIHASTVTIQVEGWKHATLNTGAELLLDLEVPEATLKSAVRAAVAAMTAPGIDWMEYTPFVVDPPGQNTDRFEFGLRKRDSILNVKVDHAKANETIQEAGVLEMFVQVFASMVCLVALTKRESQLEDALQFAQRSLDAALTVLFAPKEEPKKDDGRPGPGPHTGQGKSIDVLPRPPPPPGPLGRVAINPNWPVGGPMPGYQGTGNRGLGTGDRWGTQRPPRKTIGWQDPSGGDQMKGTPAKRTSAFGPSEPSEPRSHTPYRGTAAPSGAQRPVENKPIGVNLLRHEESDLRKDPDDVEEIVLPQQRRPFKNSV